MLKKLFGVFVLMFLMAITIPVLAQRYDSCNRGGRSYSGRHDRGRNYGYRNDDVRYNRRSSRSYGGNYRYAPAYYTPVYYPSSYYVVRRPVRRVYSSSYYAYPRYRRNNHRGRISFSIGF